MQTHGQRIEALSYGVGLCLSYRTVSYIVASTLRSVRQSSTFRGMYDDGSLMFVA
jgi:hypothetical protein